VSATEDYAALAKERYPGALVSGSGPWCIFNYCPITPELTLFENQKDAMRLMDTMDEVGCSGDCEGEASHVIANLGRREKARLPYL
jgi:hypothetical protein